jgi:beta-lactamase regulating signal transducer with metallopeptidase domain
MPVLLLPQGMTKELTDAELESVILHELIHDRALRQFHRSYAAIPLLSVLVPSTGVDSGSKVVTRARAGL